jgi:hypothetical protein
VLEIARHRLVKPNALVIDDDCFNSRSHRRMR